MKLSEIAFQINCEIRVRFLKIISPPSIISQIRQPGPGAGPAGPAVAQAVRAELREGAGAVRCEAARAREGDDPASEVVARPAVVVVRPDAPVRRHPRAGGDLCGAAEREDGAGADDRELHVGARAVHPAPRGVVELLRQERRLGPADVPCVNW